jgi:hypothetical protein
MKLRGFIQLFCLFMVLCVLGLVAWVYQVSRPPQTAPFTEVSEQFLHIEASSGPMGATPTIESRDFPAKLGTISAEELGETWSLTIESVDENKLTFKFTDPNKNHSICTDLLKPATDLYAITKSDEEALVFDSCTVGGGTTWRISYRK